MNADAHHGDRRRPPVPAGAALRDGVHAAPAFIDGFHAGLFVTVGLAVVGVLVSYLALRRFVPPAAGASLAEGVITPQEVTAPL